MFLFRMLGGLVMKLGFYTACLPEASLEELVKWAAKQGFQTLELAAWPKVRDRLDFAAGNIDVENFNEDKAEQTKILFKENNLDISALGYYDNNLHHDLETRTRYHDHLKKVIDAAQMLGVPYVGTFIGRDITKSIEENLNLYEAVFPEFVAYAEERKVSLMIENCPMGGWHPDGLPANIAYSPEIIERMFEIIPSEYFGLNFDPSHAYWLGIDHIEMTKQFANKIMHAHAKDVEILGDGLYEYGIFGQKINRTNDWDDGWWRYRVPGLGEINWSEFISTLNEVGYNGVLSIEHEDPVWGGDRDKIEKGLILGYRHLKDHII